MTVTRAEDKIGISGRLQKFRDIIRVMRKIAVHFQDKLVIASQRPGESRAIRPTQAVLLGLMQHPDLAMLGRQFIRHLAGAVGRIAVHNQQIHRNGQGQDACGQSREIVTLVVGRHNDEGVVAHGAELR